jgi:membrane protein implicated in regulation of membrane protease activity
MLWWHWSILGFCLVGVEILTLGGLGNFYFLFFGMAALMVSGLTWAGLVEAAWIQWFLFAILGIISLLVMKKPLQNKRSLNGKDEPDVDSMVGEIAKVLEPLEPQALGKVELRGSTWTARNAGENILEKNAIAKIVRVDGLTLWIQAETLTQEE